MTSLKKILNLNQSSLIIAIWTLIKVVNVFQINIWLKSIGIERPILQIVEAQILIWLVGATAILIIFYFLNNFNWFTRWTFKAILTNFLILLFFGLMVPVGPSLIYILWSDLPLNLSTFIDVYSNGTADILKDVALYYFLILSLSYSIYFYNEKKQNEVKAANLREDLTQAKLDLLQSQLQPHFLFNALHSISSLMEENVKNAQNILVNLSDLLRLSLAYQDTKFVSLKEELDVLDLYLSIQLIRFSDSLKIVKEIDPKIINVQVPPFILQPLVENSFKHGMDDELTITISITYSADYMDITIQDNGVGFETLSEGKGIKNVRTRLSALYQADYQLTITSNQRGVINNLKIPLTVKKL